MSETFGRYTVMGKLGRGAMGVVYLASDPLLNRQVAVKTVDLSVEEPGEREFLRDRLLRDARAAAVLKHPNIVGIYDVFEDSGRAYVVMEYIEGDSLATRLKNNPLPDVTAMLKVLRQMADALDYTHARGVIHRDIKPANVMIDSTGTTKIMDFGIARITDTRTVHAHRDGDGNGGVHGAGADSGRTGGRAGGPVRTGRGGVPDDDRQHAVRAQHVGHLDLQDCQRSAAAALHAQRGASPKRGRRAGEGPGEKAHRPFRHLQRVRRGPDASLLGCAHRSAACSHGAGGAAEGQTDACFAGQHGGR